VFPVAQCPLGAAEWWWWHWPLGRGPPGSRIADPSIPIPDPPVGCAEESRASLSDHHADRGGRRVVTGEQPDFDGMRAARGGVGAERLRGGHLPVCRPTATAARTRAAAN